MGGAASRKRARDGGLIMDLPTIDRALLTAHASGDKFALVRLYQEAGEGFLASGDIDAGCFYLTHAYVFALDCGASEHTEIHKTLVAYGREE